IQDAVGGLRANLARLGLPESVLGLPPVYRADWRAVPLVEKPEKPKAPGEAQAGDSAARPEAWLEPSGGMKFSLAIPGLGARVWSPGRRARAWVAALNGGVGALAGESNREIASSKAGSKRDADLKLLRHSGLM